ncbi:hypothetical protein [Deinococcus sonorensis]|uniref:Spore coat protein U domain-containing protein n=2 Tax=Deinococcus sonorensis TaxID=309891 RepID=A0AAU7UCW4_9DEIO
MKKALLIAAMASMTVAYAENNPGGRDPGAASTALNFYMTVVPGCAVNLAPSYDSKTDKTYNGTDTTVQSVVVDTTSTGNPNFRCQTGTNVTITAKALYGVGNTFEVQTTTASGKAPTTLNGMMSLVLKGYTLASGVNNDDKTLEGAYKLEFAPGNVPGGNGDIYNILATFTPDKGQFEPTVGDYKGTLNVSVNY